MTTAAFRKGSIFFAAHKTADAKIFFPNAAAVARFF